MESYRITDSVDFYRDRGQVRSAVRAIRRRRPEPLRWRRAVSALTEAAGPLTGLDRMRIEESLREVALEVPDYDLRVDVVLDARWHKVDLDRGDILPPRTMGDLRRTSFLVGTDLKRLQRYVRLPEDFDAPIDTGAVAMVTRVIAHSHRRRATQSAYADFGAEALRARIAYDNESATKWEALGHTLIGKSRACPAS